MTPRAWVAPSIAVTAAAVAMSQRNSLDKGSNLRWLSEMVGSARLRLYLLAKYDGALVRANEHDGFTFYGVCDTPTASKWLAMVRLVYLVMLTVQVEASRVHVMQSRGPRLACQARR
ncbi:hypothetical protein Tco_0319569 [Tanacetum coccineum]